MTTFRWLTPPAPAAIAVLRLTTSDATTWDGQGQSPLFLDRPLPDRGRARFAHLRDRLGATVDEVVISRLAPTVIDIATHGGIGIRAGVESALRDHGFTPADPAPSTTYDWWSRLARAPAPAPARWLMHAVKTDENIDPPTPPFPAVFLTRPPVVLITGPVNAGKSTLINAWCGRPRALVSPTPGTTRDLLTAEAICAGWHLSLLDSAGLREAPGDALEGAGQTLAIAARAHADVILHLRPPGDVGEAIPGALVVQGKADLRDPAALDPHQPRWSSHGLPDQTPAELIDKLGHAVLKHLCLVPDTTP